MHGLRLEVVEVANGAVRLRLHGAGAGIAAPLLWSLPREIEDVVFEAAPDAETVTIRRTGLRECDRCGLRRGMRGRDGEGAVDAMRMTLSSRPGNWVAAVHRIRARASARGGCRNCELCAGPLPSQHAHLAEPARQRLLCVCRSCAMLLGNRADGKYRLVPETPQMLKNFRLSDAGWELAGHSGRTCFLLLQHRPGTRRSVLSRPGWPHQSLLDLGAWTVLAACNPVLTEMEPDVEALLVNRMNGARDYYRMPIDRCYALVGLIRSHWRGVSGGGEARSAIDSFFASLGASNGNGGGRFHG